MLVKRHLEYSLLGDDPNLRIDRFPDGQQNVTILNPEDIPLAKSINLVSRMNNFRDLELIICFKACLDKLDADEGSYVAILTVPYLLGARSDRVFEKGGNNYTEMLLNIIGSFGFDVLETLDLHNPKISRHFQNELVNLTIDSPLIMDPVVEVLKNKVQGQYTHLYIQAPDIGADDRAGFFKKALGKEIGCSLNRPLSKSRTPEGIQVSNLPFFHPEDEAGAFVLIVDDICDGGGTFIEVAKAYKEKYPKIDLGLYVTHGIFSKGFAELQKYFKFVITTNSYQDFGESYFNSVKNKSLKGFLHQINIF